MQTQSKPNLQSSPEPFQFNITSPYSALVDGKAPKIPYLVSGLLTQGGLSALGAKPKCGKSSLARHLAVCVSKGQQFLGRDTTQGDVLILNLEDPSWHVANHLKALGHDPYKDGEIHIVDSLSPVKVDNFEALRTALTKMPQVRLVVIDHLAKFIRVDDIGDYVAVQRGFLKLHDIAREFPHAHLLTLIHCKKVEASDPFDTFLGSTALRGEPDTNLVIINDGGNRIITTETRVGKPIPATVLHADTVEVDESVLVSHFSLEDDYQSVKEASAQKKRQNNQTALEVRVVEYLLSCENSTAPLSEIRAQVSGNAADKNAAIDSLKEKGVISATKAIGRGSAQTLALDLTSPMGKLWAVMHPEIIASQEATEGVN